MASMNPTNFNKIMHLLNLTSSDLAQALYVSPSHVSRWKNGSRALRSTNAYYHQLLDWFLQQNACQSGQKLEHFLIADFHGISSEDPPESAQSLLKKSLDDFLMQESLAQETPVTSHAATEIGVGLEYRIQALLRFFDQVQELNPKPDIYILEINYGGWCPGYMNWAKVIHEKALRYMDAGGVVYYFSNLNNIDRATFNLTWRFNSHKNLYPGYSTNMVDESPGCIYYLAENTCSVTFYEPEDHYQSYITTVSSDPLTLTAQVNYLKKKYEQRNHQIFIDTAENRQLAFSIVHQHQRQLNPLLFVGKYPNYLFLSSRSLRALLRENHVSAKAAQRCLAFHRLFREQGKNPGIPKTFIYYREDLLDFAQQPPGLDIELTGIAGEPVSLTAQARLELLHGLQSVCMDSSCTVHILSKEIPALYEMLGEARTLWVKRNNWYFIYYPDARTQTDFRLITDNLACSARYDLYHQTIHSTPFQRTDPRVFLSDLLTRASLAPDASRPGTDSPSPLA